MKNNFSQEAKDYARIEKAIHYLGANFKQQPSLQEVAQKINMSEFHFQRLFQRWAGISPKKFLQYLTKEYTKELLTKSNLLDASYAAGLSGPGRLHDLFVSYEAMTPGEYKQKAKGLVFEYGFHPTPLGACFIVSTSRGLCHLSFHDEPNRRKILEDFGKSWKNAQMIHNQGKTEKLVNTIFSSHKTKQEKPVNLLCKGTNFQVKVWEALLRIPSGQVTSYKALAGMIGKPRAMRAVGNAVGNNPIAYLIPCHRVIRGEGLLGGYRWRISRKRAILALEAIGQKW